MNSRRATFIREIRVDPYEIPLIFKFERIFGNIYYVTRTLLFCTLFDVTCFWNDKEPFIFSGLLFFGLFSRVVVSLTFISTDFLQVQQLYHLGRDTGRKLKYGFANW